MAFGKEEKAVKAKGKEKRRLSTLRGLRLELLAMAKEKAKEKEKAVKAKAKAAAEVKMALAKAKGAELQLGMWRSDDLQKWHRNSKSFECWVDHEGLAVWCKAIQKVSCPEARKQKLQQMSIKCPEARGRMETLVDTLAEIARLGRWQPHADWIQWVPRGRNWVSDLLCNLAMDEGASMAWMRPGSSGMSIEEANYIFTSDGGSRNSRDAAAAWACWGIRQGQATLMACGVKKLVGGGGDSLKAEITALELAVAALELLSSRQEHVIPHAVDRWLNNQEVDQVLRSET